MRDGWTIRVFDSFEEAEDADRVENLARTGRERIQLLTAISTPNVDGSQPRFPGSYQILVDGPQR